MEAGVSAENRHRECKRIVNKRGVCCEADSRCEHLIQAADFLAGAVKFKIDVGLAKRDPDAIPKYVEKELRSVQSVARRSGWGYLLLSGPFHQLAPFVRQNRGRCIMKERPVSRN
jgi:hypothetical protein